MEAPIYEAPNTPQNSSNGGAKLAQARKTRPMARRTRPMARRTRPMAAQNSSNGGAKLVQRRTELVQWRVKCIQRRRRTHPIARQTRPMAAQNSSNGARNLSNGGAKLAAAINKLSSVRQPPSKNSVRCASRHQ